MLLKYIDRFTVFVISFALAFDVMALTIKILTEENGIWMSSANKPSGHYFKFYLISIDGQRTNSLTSGGGPITLEEIEFVTGGRKMQLPWSTSRRLLNLLSFGWQSIIEWNAQKQTTDFQGSIPPCSYIMFYLAFGVSDFRTPRNGEMEDLHITCLNDTIEKLQPGDVVSISNKNNSLDKNTILYLGDSLFLTWNSYEAVFYIRSSEHLVEDLPDQVQFLLISHVEGAPEALQHWVMPISIYSEMQKNHPDLFSLDHNHLPSYIK